jgi:hypothetical protein
MLARARSGPLALPLALRAYKEAFYLSDRSEVWKIAVGDPRGVIAGARPSCRDYVD